MDSLIISHSGQRFDSESSINMARLIFIFTIFWVPQLRSIVILRQICHQISVSGLQFTVRALVPYIIEYGEHVHTTVSAGNFSQSAVVEKGKRKI